MLHEFRTYTLQPGAVPQMVEHNDKVGRRVRGDEYGKLVGYWYTEIGPLNQVMHLWEYADMAERTAKRAALGRLDAWQREYVPVIRPLIVKQAIRFMTPRRAVKAPAGDGNVYEYRIYRLKPGAAPGWIEAFLGAMPVREKYSDLLCVWTSDAADPNEVSHMYAYPDLNRRAEARAALAQDPDWQAFAGANRGAIEAMHNVVLLPAPFSPLR